MFLMCCHTEGGSAIYDWFSVFIYTNTASTHAGAYAGNNKSGKTSVPPVCEGQCVWRVQCVRDGVSRV